jgi:hypothetical protein
MTRKSRVFTTIALAAAVPSSCCFIGVLYEAYEYVMQWSHSVPFDSETWKRERAVDRYDMLFDLCHHHRLIGLSVEHVEELLGQPNFDQGLGDGLALPRFKRPTSELEYWYYINREKCELIYGYDSTFFVIEFKNRVVVGYKISGG